MLKQIFKIIWKQRRTNSWIFAELLIVMGVLWFMADQLLVDTHTYNLPLGYDIQNTWRLKLGNLNSQAPGYVLPEEKTTSETDDLLRLMDQIRLSEEVEEVCATYFSCPYSFGNSWTSIEPIDGDTTGLSSGSFHVRRVTPEYFTVFRVNDKQGNSIIPQLSVTEGSMVISADLEKKFFGAQSGKGRKLRYPGSEEEIPVVAVSEPIRNSDYEISEPCLYTVLVGSGLRENVDYFSASKAELCVRLKQEMSPEDMNRFLESISERLTVNNLYVYGAKSFKDQRYDMIKTYERKSKIKVSLMAFMLINVFFGIIGTFWLRTQYRRGEIGLRVAVGSSKGGIYRFMNIEGVCLLITTLLPLLFFVVGMISADQIASDRLSLSLWRLVTVTIASYLLMGGMICLGIWLPARKAASLPPAEALRYE
ncbi:hypothetical protein M2459_002372 [Parabacteroides sp. PF5-5]|uniref:ABC transporter permease n=1 Tax=unclassified Parabacteroides TaxID=2649774 RepID=UPI0024748508|nr:MULTISPECIES: multidrug ABC transporter substrate-binding protein [unclassified Parabacteroides]MDH6305272.1 hypothetical protein [Parabacteroides sp. PH5-39]MDH6316625.1 hypothetical protein [Parabacteroides sp. PF5-13]MDH6320195.1 hypothetical protein [Parabacteroides sp. PH5-13]MDH6323862.1 hypothetical protein [Parabacteroides sp. PH5-8]MDH6327872.1 hypothetical protein [Parabacteroides sp. PH5-41]